MATRISATKLARSLSDVLSRVRYRGEEFVIERNGEAIATLAPAQDAEKPPISLKELVTSLQKKGLIPVDDSFGDDLENIRSSQTKTEPPTWDN